MFIVIFILTLLFLVISHEFGHFITAKKFGIKVLEFGFGIPPKIWSKKIGETILSFNLLPIGGFVRLLGEDELDKTVLNDPKSFAQAKVWKRLIVVMAGVVMNLVLAWLIFYVVLTAQDFRIVYPTSENVVTIARVEPGFPAGQAGVLEGDRLLKVNDQSVTLIEEAVSKIKANPDKEIILTLSDVDGNHPHQIKITPKKVSSTEGLIGVVFSPLPFKTYRTFDQKLFSGISYSWDLTRLTFMGLGNLTHQLSVGQYKQASENVAGPIGLGNVSRNILSLGKEAVLPYLWFIAVISLTLAIFNSLPLPALDGGRAFFLLFELITGKKVHAGFEKWVHTVGMAILLMLIALVTYSDILKLF